MKTAPILSSVAGLALTLAVSVGAFLAVRPFIGALAGGICAGVAFVAWTLFNMHAATTGLFKANLRVYFRRRSKGASHEEAMARMVQTRYPFSPEKQMAVMDAMPAPSDWPFGDSEGHQVKSLVYAMYLHELGAVPPADYSGRVYEKLDRVYHKMRRKYAKSE